MPPKCKFTREEIISSALELIRDEGASALTARALAERLNSSAKPIFGLFKSMDEVKTEAMAAADALYKSYLEKDMAEGKYPPYKASGMAYIRFAHEEKELFKLLFMRDRTEEKPSDGKDGLRPILEIIEKNLGISEDEAYLFHLRLWIFVHGIAVMAATSYVEFDDEFVSRAITDAYEGFKHQLERKGK